MQRWWPAGVVLASLAAGALLVWPFGIGASASAVTVTVSPDSGLVDDQTVTISGRGLVHSYHGSAQTWFATECTAAVQGRMNPSTDTSHCDITDAKAIRVARNGTFETRYRVTTGIIGDGYCGTPGHLGCVIGVGTAEGLGTVVRITFESPSPPAPLPAPAPAISSGSATTTH
jgi:hypothetical protein